MKMTPETARAEPLTDEQIIEHGRYWSNRRFAEGASRFLMDFARAIERAHGIGVRHCGSCADGVPGGPDNCSKCGREQQYSHWTPRFEHTYCSQCGGEFGPGDQGYSHCKDHTQPQRLSLEQAQEAGCFEPDQPGPSYMRHKPNETCECHDCHIARTRGAKGEQS